MLALMKKGLQVLLPYGDNAPYDLAFERDSKILKVQCKTGKLKNGTIRFRLHSVARDVEAKKYVHVQYTGIDYFGVYCPDNEKTYLIPASELGTTEGCLRVDPTKQKITHWAFDFEI